MMNVLKKTAAVSLAAIMTIGNGASAMEEVITISAPIEPSVAVEASVRIPVSAPLSNNDAGDFNSDTLTKSILRFKELFGSTDKYTEFNHNFSEYNGYSSVNLNWSCDNEYISFSVTNAGNVISYSYQNYDTEYKNLVIPEISKQDALDISLEWAMKIAPGYYKYISPKNATVTYRRSGSYRVNLYAYIEDKQLDSQSISLTIGPDGTLIGYEAGNAMFGIAGTSDFEKAKISLDEAKEKLSALEPFRLVYRSFYDYDTELKRSVATVKLVYEPNSGFGNTVIDAVTGEALELVTPSSYNKYNDAVAEESAPTMSAADAGAGLTEVEIEAVKLQESFLTVEEIEENVRRLGIFDFSEDYYYLKTNVRKKTSSYTGKESYIRNVVWKIDSEKAGYNLFAEVSCDAETGEIFSFNSGRLNYVEEELSDARVLELKGLCDEAIKKLTPYYGEYIANDMGTDDSIKYDAYSQNYTRYENGIEVIGDSIHVAVNLENGLINRYSINRIDGELESLDGVISVDEANNSYYDNIGVVTSYITAGSYGDGKLTRPANNLDTTEKTPVLVYRFGDSCLIDAKTGKMINYSGNDYTKRTTEYFTSDVFLDGGDAKEALMMLFNMNIIPGVEHFNPSDEISEEDFIEILSSAVGYAVAVSAEEAERDKSLPINCIDATKVIVDRLGYSDVAKLSGIFKIPFETSAEIAEEDVGYVAITYAMGLLESLGDSFDPSSKLTRGDAAEIVYAYILREAGK